MTKLPHDRKKELKITNRKYQKFVEIFFEQELKNDGVDITSEITINKRKNPVKAIIIAKESGILAGRAEIQYFLSKNKKIKQKWHKKDGEKFKKNDLILELTGNLHILLKFERILLNFISRMSGISTKTAQNVQKIAHFAKLSATRKTLWGILDKKAVALGGGLTHRLNLEDAILIKENHLAHTNIKTALNKIDKTKKEFSFWEIEVENEQELKEVMENLPKKRPGVIMLDNFTPRQIKKVLKKTTKPKRIFFEASGGITEKNIKKYAKTGAEVLSAGFLTKNAFSIDFSMYIKTND